MFAMGCAIGSRSERARPYAGLAALSINSTIAFSMVERLGVALGV
jgi:hypothetical protein